MMLYICNIRKYFSKHITKLLINDLVLSRIDYCGSLVSYLKNIEVKKIDRIIALIYALFIISIVVNI